VLGGVGQSGRRCFLSVRYLFGCAGAIALISLDVSAQTFTELKSSQLPDRAVLTESVQRIKIRDEDSRYLTFVELENENAYRSVMDCKDWRTRRYTINRPRPFDQPSYFYENNASLNHIQLQSEYCPRILELSLSNIDYERSMRLQVWKDRSLLPKEYFLKCPQKDASQWACIDFREEWKDFRWDPKP
jgi:hypothetical protein